MSLAAALGMAALALTGAANAAAPLSYARQVTYLQAHQIDTTTLTPKYLVKPPNAAADVAAKLASLSAAGQKPADTGVTVPYWSTKITSPLDGKTYQVSMVGGSPYAATPTNTTVTYVPIVLRININGFVFDPTLDANCDSRSASGRFFASPLFYPAKFSSNGVGVSGSAGAIQLESAFQRANFWDAVKGAAYGVTLAPSRSKPIVLDYTADPVTYPGDVVLGVRSRCVPGQTNALGVMDINEYDAVVQQIAAQFAKPNQIPVVLAYNVVLDEGYPANETCCIIGYHNAIPVTGGTQLYAVGTYVDPGIFTGPHGATEVSDISAWSHELAELIDDPFVQGIEGAPGGLKNDLTPAWGHVGQVPHCQDNLEVGDPLTGSYFAVKGDEGFVYHYQDLAFHDWFYRTASTSTGGSGSFKGLFAGGGQPTICTP